MATWHQLKANVRLFDEKLWTLVIDPPNALRCVVRCETQEEAEELQRKHEHSYVLRPAPFLKPVK